MKPGQLVPNELEIAVLQRIATDQPDRGLNVDGLRVLSREYTGVGCFTNFQCEGAENDKHDDALHLNSLITVPGVSSGLGAVLFTINNKPKCLELFTYEEYWDGMIEGYAIK